MPILPKALQILTEWLPRKNSDDDLIFVGPRGGHSFPREAWDRALKQAEIEDFTFHGLRHTAASWMIQEGIQETKAQELLGHESIVTMRRYTHLVQERNAEELREAMLKRGAEG